MARYCLPMEMAVLCWFKSVLSLSGRVPGQLSSSMAGPCLLLIFSLAALHRFALLGRPRNFRYRVIPRTCRVCCISASQLIPSSRAILKPRLMRTTASCINTVIALCCISYVAVILALKAPPHVISSIIPRSPEQFTLPKQALVDAIFFIHRLSEIDDTDDADLQQHFWSASQQT